MTEYQLEQEALGWLAEVGYAHLYGPDIAVDDLAPDAVQRCFQSTTSY